MNKKLIIGALLAVVVVIVITFSLNLGFIGNAVQKETEPASVKDIGKYESDLGEIACYCDCEHTDLYDCYEKGMLINCGLCMKEYETYLEMKDEKSIEEISEYIDNRWGEKNE